MTFKPVMKQIAAALALAFGLGSAVAQAPADQGSALLTSVSKGLQNSPRLDSEVHALEAMMEEANISFSFMLPTVDVRGSTGRERSKFGDGDARTYNANSYGIEARQNLFNGFASQARYLGAYSDAMSQYYKVLDVANQLAKEAAVAHIKVSRSQRQMQLAEQHVQYHRDLMARIEEKVTQGVSRSADLEQAKARYTSALSALATEKANTFSAMAEYQTLTNTIWPVNELGNHVVETNFEIENPDRVVHALNNHYLLKSANAKLWGAKHNITVAQEGFYPRLDLRAKSDRYSNFLSTFDERTITSVDLLASMNLFRGGADKAAQNAAVKRRHQAFDRKLIVCKAIRQQAQVGLYDVMNTQKRVGYFQEQADAIQKARAAYEQQYQIGRRNLIDLLNAESEYYQAQRNVLAVQSELSEAKINLLAASGQLIDLFGIENLIGANEPTKRKVMFYQEQINNADSEQSCPADLINLDSFNLPNIGFDPSMKSVRQDLPPTMAAAAPPVEAIQVAQAAPSTARLAPSNPAGQFIDPAKVSNKLIDQTKAWANAWQARDVAAYIGFYANEFKPEEGTFDTWQVMRRQRLINSQDIQIKLSEIQVVPSFDDPSIYETTFIQQYRSKNYKERSRKVLTWRAKSDGSWQIIREQNLPENTVLNRDKAGLAMASQSDRK